ncbi:hypothetical protein [Stakelama marina]|nr:hypothetical protein [Stakelama marina]
MGPRLRPAWLLTVLGVVGVVLAAWVVIFFLRNLWVILNSYIQT